MKPRNRAIVVLVFLLLPHSIAGCGRPSADEARRQCLQPPASAVPVSWRALPGAYSMNGGSSPPMPEVAFPIVDEPTFAGAFPELAGQVDFERERVVSVSGYAEASVLWIALVEGKLVLMKQGESAWCSGQAPELFGTLVVVPNDARPVQVKECGGGGSCSGPPRV